MTGHRHGLPNHDLAGARSSQRRRLFLVFGLVVVFMVAEVVAGVLTGSLALISDAGHMATDALGLGMSLAAIAAATKASRGNHRTFGFYRTEILAALANAVLLFAVAGYVIYEAIQRINEPAGVETGPMLTVAVIGLVVNLFGWWTLREGADESLNVEGAMLEVVADLFSSLGVIIAALIILLTGWVYADPLIAAAIGLFILPRAYRLGRKALRVLMQAAPDDIDVGLLDQRLKSLTGVTGIHDLHVWTLTSGMPVATVHLTTTLDSNRDSVLEQARHLLRDEFAVTHATLQVESADAICAELTW